MANDYSLHCNIGAKRYSLIQHSFSKKKSKLTVILFFVLTLVTSGSAYASVIGGINLDLNVAFAKSDGDSGSGGGGDDDSTKKSKGDSSDTDNGDSSSDSNKKSKSSSGDGGGGGSSSSGGEGGSGDSGGSGTSTSMSPPTTEENTAPPSETTSSPPSEQNTAPQTQTQPTCTDGSLPDANGKCPSLAPEQNALSTPPSPQTNQQTCPDGAAPDVNGVCPPTSEGAPPTNTPQANMLTGGIQTAAPIKSPPPEPFEGCPGHVTRNANGICLSPLSKDSPCAEGFHHDASGKCVDNKIPLADGTCAGGYSLENIDGKNTCNGKDVGPCPGNVARDANGICFDLRPNAPCAQDFHRDTVINGGKCVDNSIPYAGFCVYGYHMVSTGGCARNDVPFPDGTCYGGYHAVSSTTEKGKKLSNCYPNEFPIGAGTCAKTWYFVAAWNGCMPGLPVQSGGKCPQGYHKNLMNVKDKDNLCAADPDTLTKLTTSPQPNQQPTQTGGGTGMQPTGTGNMPTTPQTGGGTTGTGTGTHPTGGGTGMGNTPSTQLGGTTGTNTNPTTTPTPPTSTTNVINRGGSSGGGGSTSTTSAPPVAQATFLTYVNAINKISMKYPSTWTKTELVGNPSIPVMFNAPIAATTATTAGTKTNFVISITPRATNLDSFTLQQINGLIQSKAVKYAITDTNAKILTPPSSITSYREISYDGMKNDNGVQVPLKGAAILFVNGGTGYSLLYLAKQTEYTQNLPMVQQMINSFLVGGGSSAPVQNVAAAAGVPR